MANALQALVEGLRSLNTRFCIVGALVQELLLDVPPPRRTNDADAVVFVPTLEEFAAVKDGLIARGFEVVRPPHRLGYQGTIVDILPYSHDLAPDGTLRLPPNVVLNMAGFEHAIEASIQVTLESGLEVPVIPLPLYAILKLVAYTDRRANKDLEAVEHLLQHYATDDDRLWELEYNGALVEFEYGNAYLLGLDGARFIDSHITDAVVPLLASLSEGARMTAAEAQADEDREGEWKPRAEDLFAWYRRGLAI